MLHVCVHIYTVYMHTYMLHVCVHIYTVYTQTYMLHVCIYTVYTYTYMYILLTLRVPSLFPPPSLSLVLRPTALSVQPLSASNA